MHFTPEDLGGHLALKMTRSVRGSHGETQPLVVAKGSSESGEVLRVFADRALKISGGQVEDPEILRSVLPDSLKGSVDPWDRPILLCCSGVQVSIINTNPILTRFLHYHEDL
jgi:hypothetical protein